MRILFFDEMSMIGRQFMGRIDSRLNQAKAGLNPTGASLGGVSSILSGDPAQCEAISDQQPYDTCSHRDTASAGESKKVILSNAGLAIYGEFGGVLQYVAESARCCVSSVFCGFEIKAIQYW